MEIGKFVKKKRKEVPLEERFWEKVDKKGEDECWEWKGYKNTDGYGRIRYMQKMTLVHRVSWEIYNGKIPVELRVLHSCDNPACINPNHLFLGTQQDNIKDRHKKGRTAKGEDLSEKTWDDINNIRKKYVDGVKTTLLAEEYNLSSTEIREIVKNNVWKDDNYNSKHIQWNEGEKSPSSKLNLKTAREIRDKVSNGKIISEVALEFDVSITTIKNVINGKAWIEY